MTHEEFNLLTSDLFERVTAGEIVRPGESPKISRDANKVVRTPEAQAVLRYFYTKLVVDSELRPNLNGPVPSLRLLKVVRMLGAGLGNREIASGLGWTHQGVKSATVRLFDRTGCKNRWALGLWAREHSAWLEREIHQLEVLESSNVNGVVFSDRLPSSDNMSTF